MRAFLESLAFVFIGVVILWLAVSAWLDRLRVRQMQKDLDALYDEANYSRPGRKLEP